MYTLVDNFHKSVQGLNTTLPIRDSIEGKDLQNPYNRVASGRIATLSRLKCSEILSRQRDS